MKLLQLIIESAIRNLSGGFGHRLRYYYYKFRFKKCGKNVRIDEGVIFHNPENILIGNNVWIGSYSILTALPSYIIENKELIQKKNESYSKSKCNIELKDNIHIGSFNIIQGYGGVLICNNCTTSANVKIYSQSNLPSSKTKPKEETGASTMVKDKIVPSIAYPIVLNEGVWLGIGVCVFGGNIGKYTFVKTYSLVLGDLNSYSIYSGNPIRFEKKRYS